jgi:hypothetical protein
MCSQPNPNVPEEDNSPPARVRQRIERFLRKWPDAKQASANDLATNLYADPSTAISEKGPAAITAHKAAVEALKCWQALTNDCATLTAFFEWSEEEMQRFFEGAVNAHLTPYEGQNPLGIAIQEAEWYGMADFWRNFEGNLKLWRKELLQPQLPF